METEEVAEAAVGIVIAADAAETGTEVEIAEAGVAALIETVAGTTAGPEKIVLSEILRITMDTSHRQLSKLLEATAARSLLPKSQAHSQSEIAEGTMTA